jgi:DNA-binding MarR family transcriptional regulator
MTDSVLPEDRMMALLRRLGTLPILRPPKELPLSPPQVALLNWVARSPGCGVQEIARELHITPPTVSVGIRRLIRDGWIEQRNDPADRRARPLFLTEKGIILFDEICAHRSQALSLFLSTLASEEQEQLIALLERAVGAMEQAWSLTNRD